MAIPSDATARAAADRARGEEPHRSDPALAAVRRARIGTPAEMRTPDGSPAGWLVPFVDGAKACGFARVEPDGRVSRIGSFGGGAEDRAAWPEADFFDAPPRQALQEIARRHPGADLDGVVFSYDGSPSRWAWRVDLGADGAAFIGPAGWYLRHPNG